MTRKKENRPLIWTIAIGLLLLAIVVATSPKPVDWSYSFSQEDKIPLGNKALFELLPKAFPNRHITTAHTTLTQQMQESDLTETAYIIINNSYSPDSLEAVHLLRLVENGGHVFIAAKEFSKFFADTLKLKLDESFDIFNGIGKKDSLVLNFANPQIKTANGYVFHSAYNDVSFTSYDTTQTTILGINSLKKANFIGIKHGQGELFINCSPMAFTNYNLVSDNHAEYIFKCLSYLPVQNVVWDEYYKAKPRSQGSFWGIMANNKALHRAWALLLALVAVYMVVESKRRQRAIPVVVPPSNTSLQFTETVGRLYFSRKNHLDIATKKYTYFSEFVRTSYYINLTDANREELQNLSSKSTVSSELIEKIVKTGQQLPFIKSMSEREMIDFNQKIEFFYHHCK